MKGINSLSSLSIVGVRFQRHFESCQVHPHAGVLDMIQGLCHLSNSSHAIQDQGCQQIHKIFLSTYRHHLILMMFSALLQLPAAALR